MMVPSLRRDYTTAVKNANRRTDTDVRRLQIAVHDPVLVGVVDRAGEGRDQLRGRRGLQRLAG